MTRYKEFDRQYVLDQAMNLFWEQGYEKTSINDLKRKMEISSQTLYNTFEDKYNLFLQSFDRHVQLGRKKREELLSTPNANLNNIKKYIEYLVSLYTEVPGYGGCLLRNTISEFGNSDPVVNKKIEKENQAIEDSFIHAIKNAKQMGILNEKTNVKQLATFISIYILGISNMSKLGKDRKSLQKQINLLFDMISSYKN